MSAAAPRRKRSTRSVGRVAVVRASGGPTPAGVPARGGRVGRGCGDRGASPVELAILLPGILVLLFASIQVAAVFLARAVALNAAQVATSAERAYRAPTGVGTSRAQDFLARSGDWLTGSRVTVVRDGNQVTTTVEGQALSLLPGMSFDVRQQAHGTVERFTTEEDDP